MVTVRAYLSSLKKHNDLVIDVGFHLGGDARGYRRFAYVDQSTNPFRSAPNRNREGDYVDTPLTLKHSGYFGDEMAGRWASIGPTLLRAEALRIHHNLAGYGGAWTHDPLTRPHAWRTKIASRLRRPFRREKGHSWYGLYARLDISQVGRPRVPI